MWARLVLFVLAAGCSRVFKVPASFIAGYSLPLWFLDFKLSDADTLLGKKQKQTLSYSSDFRDSNIQT